ncbi:MAG: hypothetical protein EAZ53_13625 [Bacteroidetes bacterium]|nr:MAG: hypothetical protein EAZ53_13625 [Bacteroidota bacterium]
MNNKVFILLDADVVIHLYKGNKISLLNELYFGRLRMLDIVLTELLNNRTIRDTVENLFRFKQVEEIKFPTTSHADLLKEYIALKNTIIGNGERASLLFCKYNNHVIASSNTKDILPFCNKNKIAFLTTLDILAVAVQKSKIQIIEANECIKQIIKNNESHLFCHDIEEFMSKHFDKEKLSY